ncbi:hypothetical protein CPB83DRAFT_895054 [Crepidotus variabilis]|uniref:Cellobiose dehydrogenase-like cytochrome domain-containing protein n=1 Tax=Crepidotus variabilis TaxID=179855 RepID=A0A9P6EDW3_9AGAR|nr:hypothetical protein CPB83DRAFT_895054 [Crepidotus variabilis]
MTFLLWTIGLLFAVITTNAQSAGTWCDASTPVAMCFQRYSDAASGVGWGYAFPTTPGDDFIGFWTAPVAVGWVGASLGGSMKSNLLLAAWTNDANATVSPRFTTVYAPPAVYSGPIITILSSSGVNDTHQRIVFHCANCTSWGASSIPQSGSTTFGYVLHGTSKPVDPADADTVIQKHTASGKFTIDISAARSDQYPLYLQYLLNPATPLPPSIPPPTIPPISSSPSPTSIPLTTVLQRV